MGRILTNRYAKLFEKRIHNPFRFARDVFKSGKSREIVSFIVWEIFHRLRLFPKKRYLEFTGGEAIQLDDVRSDSPELQAFIERFFRKRDLRMTRADHNWKLLFIKNDGGILGCLYPDDKALYRSVDNGKSLVFLEKFPERIKSIFVSSQNTIFVGVKGAVYRSSDNGASFQKVVELGSTESFFRHNNAMTETADGTLIIGEYGNIWDEDGWRQLAYLYFSSDNGETWDTSDFLIKRGTNKHIHLVKYSKLFNKIFMADGDNFKKLWVTETLNGFDIRNPQYWKPVNRFHIQMGGHTSVVETDQKILFGTDYQGGTNFIVETADGENYVKRVVPDPYRRSPIDNMAQRKSKSGREIWANLPYSTANSRCLLMYSVDNGTNWNKVFEYSRATHTVWLLSSATELLEDLYISIEGPTKGDRVVFKVSDL